MAGRMAESPQQMLLKRLLEAEANAREQRMETQQQIKALEQQSAAEDNKIVATAQAEAQAEAEKRPDLLEVHGALDAEWTRLHQDLLMALAGEGAESPQLSAETIRRRANSLALRMTQAYLAATKGAGFLANHPASRFVREAMFFLVWSCPQPVLAAQLQEFACTLE